MNRSKYQEIKPKIKFIKKLYVSVMLFVVGRAIQAASKIDKEIKQIFKELPDNFSFSLGVMPSGPSMFIGKNKKGKVKYQGWSPVGKKPELKLYIKNLEAAMLVFTFRESTAVAFAHDRFIVDGDPSLGLPVVEVLNLVEVYLLPKLIAKLAVKRYPKWSEMSPLRKHFGRILIYIRAFTF